MLSSVDYIVFLRVAMTIHPLFSRTVTVTIYPDFVEKQKDTSSATCDVSDPKEKIQWFHAGTEIEEGENYDIHGENNTLTIRNMGSFFFSHLS